MTQHEFMCQFLLTVLANDKQPCTEWEERVALASRVYDLISATAPKESRSACCGGGGCASKETK